MTTLLTPTPTMQNQDDPDAEELVDRKLRKLAVEELELREAIQNLEEQKESTQRALERKLIEKAKFEAKKREMRKTVISREEYHARGRPRPGPYQ